MSLHWESNEGGSLKAYAYLPTGEIVSALAFPDGRWEAMKDCGEIVVGWCGTIDDAKASAEEHVKMMLGE